MTTVMKDVHGPFGAGQVYHVPGRGDSLPNGAIILDETVLIEGGRVNGVSTTRKSIVLALQPGAHQPFVSWNRWVTLGPTATGEVRVTDDCMWGHYNRSLLEAVSEYDDRCRAQQKAYHRHGSKSDLS